MTPIIKGLSRRGESFILVHAGQHYDYNLSLQFIDELDLPQPNYSFKLLNQNPASQTAEMMMKLEKIILKRKTDLLLIQGDTNTTLAAALVGFKQRVPVAHIEAGLRSYDMRMQEEHNRRMIDHASRYLFAPTEISKENLLRENVWGEIHVTGNTVVDALTQYFHLVDKRGLVMEKVKFNDFALATVHRAENVDSPEVLQSIVDAFIDSPLPVVIPLHPRTRKKLKQFNLWEKISSCGTIQVLPPLGYLEFIYLMKKCKIILTDSGGLQEEATVPLIRKKVIVLRNSTERPEAVKAGFAKIAGLKKENILKCLNEALNDRTPLPKESPFGDGRASERILKVLLNKQRFNLLKS